MYVGGGQSELILRSCKKGGRRGKEGGGEGERERGGRERGGGERERERCGYLEQLLCSELS